MMTWCPSWFVFCIEGFFILIGLLTLIQRSREHTRRRELWLSLRGSFRDFALTPGHCFPGSRPVNPRHRRELETDPKVIDRMLEQLAKKHPDLDSMVALKRER